MIGAIGVISLLIGIILLYNCVFGVGFILLFIGIIFTAIGSGLNELEQEEINKKKLEELKEINRKLDERP